MTALWHICIPSDLLPVPVGPVGFDTTANSDPRALLHARVRPADI